MPIQVGSFLPLKPSSEIDPLRSPAQDDVGRDPRDERPEGGLAQVAPVGGAPGSSGEDHGGEDGPEECHCPEHVQEERPERAAVGEHTTSPASRS